MVNLSLKNSKSLLSVSGLQDMYIIVLNLLINSKLFSSIPARGGSTNTCEKLYVGQSYNFKRRHRDHFSGGSSSADKNLQKIGKGNIDVIILHEKTFNEFEDNKQNRDAYQEWANNLEILEIEQQRTLYPKGLNKLKGGQHKSKKEAFIEYNHLLSDVFFENFIKAARIHNEKETSILGACPRKYTIPEMDNYPLGEKLHKFRNNDYPTIWAIQENVDTLNEVGYTKTSEEAGVDKHERSGNARIDNKWEKIVIVLKWIFDEHGHINLTQGSDNPENFPEKLLDGLNYTKISQIIVDLRGNHVIGADIKRKEYLKSLNYFENGDLFQDHKFIIGLKWYYENYPFSFPQQCIKIPDNTGLPK